MAEAILERTDRPELRRLAEAIVATQRQEIRSMEAMSRDRLVTFAEIPLETVGDSGVSGTVTVDEVDGGVRVDLDVEGLPKPGTTYLAHIHPGTCGGGEEHAGEGHGGHMGTGQPVGDIQAPLTPVEADAEGRGRSTTVVENATVDGLISGEPTFINVHAAGSGNPPPLACANLGEVQ
jgi:hypothetical protein